MTSSACRASMVLWASMERGVSSPIFFMASRNSSRSSALSMASAVAPIISTLNFSRTPILRRRERAVERGLAAHGGQQRVGALLFDDLGDDFGGDRLHIGGVGQVRIGHDGGRIGVDQDDPVALFLERLAGLGAGIIELAGLPDDDRSRTDDEDRFDVGAFWHGARSVRSWCAAKRERSPATMLRPRDTRTATERCGAGQDLGVVVKGAV